MRRGTPQGVNVFTCSPGSGATGSAVVEDLRALLAHGAGAFPAQRLRAAVRSVLVGRP